MGTLLTRRFASELLLSCCCCDYWLGAGYSAEDSAASQILTSSTLCPAFTAPVCISILSVEYSVMYDSEMVSPAESGQ